uniref:Putative secreted protein n=1 Tax=Ixodes scapularis TaxID=6945 RepID=A0A4D5RGD9_IXOSC
MRQRSLTSWVCIPCATATGTSRRHVPPAGTAFTRVWTGSPTSSEIRSRARLDVKEKTTTTLSEPLPLCTETEGGPPVSSEFFFFRSVVCHQSSRSFLQSSITIFFCQTFFSLSPPPPRNLLLLVQ